MRVGLDKVKGLTVRRANEIVAQREVSGVFANLKDLLERVPIGGRELAALVLSGACDGLAPLQRENYPFVHEAVLKKLQQGCFLAELEEVRVIPQQLDAAEAARLRLYQSLVRARNELLYLEMHLSGHPMSFLRGGGRGEAGGGGCRHAAGAGRPGGAAVSHPGG